MCTYIYIYILMYWSFACLFVYRILRPREGQADRAAVGLLLRPQVLRGASHLPERGGLGGLHPGARHLAVLREGDEGLGGAALRPPQPHPLGLRELGVEDEAAALEQGPAPAAVPLLHGDALQAHRDALLEDDVVLLRPLAPERDPQARRGVVGDRDLALHQLLAVLRRDFVFVALCLIYRPSA